MSHFSLIFQKPSGLDFEIDFGTNGEEALEKKDRKIH